MSAINLNRHTPPITTPQTSYSQLAINMAKLRLTSVRNQTTTQSSSYLKQVVRAFTAGGIIGRRSVG